MAGGCVHALPGSRAHIFLRLFFLAHLPGIVSTFSVNTGEVILYTALFLVLSVTIIMGGVKDGIEKASKVLMPVLFLILVVAHGHEHGLERTVVALLAGLAIFPSVAHFDPSLLGSSKGVALMFIILPQVFKRIMPSITNEVVTLVKDTSMAFTVSYQEMFTIGKQIANSQTSFMPFLVAGVFYFVFNAIVDFVMGKIEKRMDYYK